MHLFQGSITLGEQSLLQPGSLSMGEHSLQQQVSQPIVSASESTVPVPQQNVSTTAASTNPYTPVAVTCTKVHDKSTAVSVINTVITSNTCTTTSSPASTVTTSKHPSVYRKAVPTVPRRNFTSPFIVRNGHKVQCLMVPPKSMTSGQYIVAQIPEDTTTPKPWSIP